MRAFAFCFHTTDSRKSIRTAIGVKGMEEGHEWVHMRVTGYGMYSEQLLWRQNTPFLCAPRLGNIPSVISYAPLVLDWVGSKLSKSLYVERGHTNICRTWASLLSSQKTKESGQDHKNLFEEVIRLESPKKLFRI